MSAIFTFRCGTLSFVLSTFWLIERLVGLAGFSADARWWLAKLALIPDDVSKMILGAAVACGALYFAAQIADLLERRKLKTASVGTGSVTCTATRNVLPETQTWIRKKDVVMMFLRSDRIAAVKLEWARKYNVKNSLEEAMVQIDNQFAERDREIMVGTAIDVCFREIESDYPAVRKKGQYSKEIVQWWLNR
ncbi:MAG: hypothetical protein OXI17_12880 [Gammaproteobacteria bacterium]|nr:hypothetical protein [Gammaproteobacteria bacterium]